MTMTNPNYYYTLLTRMRWDQLAYMGYGDICYTPDLVNANPQLPTYDWVPEGSTIIFPYIPQVTSTTLLSQMPPWIQSQG